MTALPSSELIELGKEAVDWALHVGRVGLWALVAMWCGLTTVRLAALFVLRLQRRAPAVGPPRPLLVAALVALGGVGAGAVAVRPDERFFVMEGGFAAERHDCAAVVRYLEPLTRWNSARPEVYENLGVCYVQAGRYRDAIAVLQRARALALTPESFALSALAHHRVGEDAMARQELRAALALARSAGQRAAIARELGRLEPGGPPSP